jgi:hypothetical protein
VRQPTVRRRAAHNFAFLISGRKCDMTPLLPGVACRTLFTVDRPDWTMPAARGRMIAVLIAGAQSIVPPA